MATSENPASLKGWTVPAIIAVLTALYEVPQIGHWVAGFLDQHEAIAGLLAGLLAIVAYLLKRPAATPEELARRK